VSAQSFEIPLPPADVELGFQRKPLRYLAAVPAAGIGPDTGIVLFICPWGIAPDDPYCREALLPQLAERYDCIVAAPSYFGLGLKRNSNATLAPPPMLGEAIKRLLGDAVSTLPLDRQLMALAEAGLAELPAEFTFSVSCFPEYQSFGLMPALDGIAVLADLLRRFPVRRDRLHCFGSSYGGYVASLMLKLVPNSFHAIVENSGFVAAQPVEMSNADFDVRHWTKIAGLRVPVREASPWSFRDAASRYFAGPSVMAIRDCTIADHFVATKSLVRSYHSVEDKLIPIGDKRKFWAALVPVAALRATEVGPDRLDGRLFKTLDHGMDASLIGLMADAMADVPFAGADAETDFDRETEREIRAADRIYRLRFGRDLSFTATVDAVVP
jgi:pimeloyl-ACP methyl ester carboxylesterase